MVAFESQLECGFMEDERSGMHIGTGLDLPPQRQRGGAWVQAEQGGVMISGFVGFFCKKMNTIVYLMFKCAKIE